MGPKLTAKQKQGILGLKALALSLVHWIGLVQQSHLFLGL